MLSHLQCIELCFVKVHLVHYDNGWRFCSMHQRQIVLCDYGASTAGLLLSKERCAEADTNLVIVCDDRD